MISQRIATVVVLSAAIISSCKMFQSQPSQTSSAIGSDDAQHVEQQFLNLSRAPTARATGVKMLQLANAVARLDRIRSSCTAWLVTDEHMVTNQHCVSDDYREQDTSVDDGNDRNFSDVCKDITFHFDHQKEVAAARGLSDFVAPMSEKRGCKRIIMANARIDFALIELDRSISSDVIQPLKIAAEDAVPNTTLWLIGQPDAGPKKISFENRNASSSEPCVIVGKPQFPPGKTSLDNPAEWVRGRDLHSYVHNCDTYYGSSGSPVFSAVTKEVVGLHWNGWLRNKWAYYHESGIIDGNSQYHDTDHVKYRPGNAAIRLSALKQGLQIAASRGIKIPLKVAKSAKS